MIQIHQLNVAVLLATYNGERFIEQQIRSLTDNETPFTLHWLDDHSTDNTRGTVITVSRSLGIELVAWHTSQRLALPAVFFQLLEKVEADVYLFCDQDDIWQPGKIDAAVADLLPDLMSPLLNASDPFVFRGEDARVLHRLSDVTGTIIQVEESRMFMPAFGPGHTQAFTRPLRDSFVKHKDIARAYAYMHDMWIYDIALASGTARILHNAPTTLHRWHGGNASGVFGSWSGEGVGRVTITWEQQQRFRRSLSRHAAGFILASATLPPGPKLERALAIATLVATLDRRQSPADIVRLAQRRIMWQNRHRALGLALSCLCSNADD